MLNERPSVDITRARIVTQVHREHQGEPLVSVWGQAMHRLFTELPIDIAPGELIVGGPTLRPRAAQLFPEVQSGWLGAELDSVSTRAWDPLLMSDADRAEVRDGILPFWKGKTIAERLFTQCPPETAPLIYLEPGGGGPRVQPASSTTTPSFKRASARWCRTTARCSRGE